MGEFSVKPIDVTAEKLEKIVEMNINDLRIDETSDNNSFPTSKVVHESIIGETTKYLPLEAETVWTFDGGDASTKINPKYVIDNAISNTSKNAVQNNVVKKYVDEKTKNTEEKVAAIEDTIENFYNQPVSVENGGTGANNPKNARSNLGIAAAIESFTLGNLQSGVQIHKFQLDNGLKCAIGRNTVTAVFPQTANAGSLYTVDVTISITDLGFSSVHQAFVSPRYDPAPMWAQIRDFDKDNLTIRFICTAGNERRPIIYYMIFGE